VPAHRQAARYVWALLLARIYEVLPLLCPRCGGEMRIIAFITEAAVIRAIPGHLGQPEQPPRLRPARGPPLCELPDRGSDAINPQAQPMPDHEFGKRVAWQATDDKARSPGATRACSYPSGKLPPARWPQAHTMGMPGRGFNGLSGVCGAKSTIDADG